MRLRGLFEDEEDLFVLVETSEVEMLYVDNGMGDLKQSGKNFFGQRLSIPSLPTNSKVYQRLLDSGLTPRSVRDDEWGDFVDGFIVDQVLNSDYSFDDILAMSGEIKVVNFQDRVTSNFVSRLVDDPSLLGLGGVDQSYVEVPLFSRISNLILSKIGLEAFLKGKEAKKKRNPLGIIDVLLTTDNPSRNFVIEIKARDAQLGPNSSHFVQMHNQLGKYGHFLESNFGQTNTYLGVSLAYNSVEDYEICLEEFPLGL